MLPTYRFSQVDVQRDNPSCVHKTYHCANLPTASSLFGRLIDWIATSLEDSALAIAFNFLCGHHLSETKKHSSAARRKKVCTD